MPRFTWIFSCQAATPQHVLAAEVPMGERLTSQFAWFMSRNTFQEYLKAANSLRRETSITSLPCCPSLTPTPTPILLCQPPLRRRGEAALRGRRWATCLVCFPHLASGLMCNYSLQEEEKASWYQFVSLLRSSDSKKWKVKWRNFLPLRKIERVFWHLWENTMCGSSEGVIGSSNLKPEQTKFVIKTGVSFLMFLQKQRVEINHYFLKEIITSDQSCEALPAP